MTKKIDDLTKPFQKPALPACTTPGPVTPPEVMKHHGITPKPSPKPIDVIV